MNAKAPVLDSLGFQIKDHWKEHRPRMYRELEQMGQLDQSVYEAQERTGAAHWELIQAGMDDHAAWEMIREQWAFLPAEEDDVAALPEPAPEQSEEPVEPNPLFLHDASEEKRTGP